MVFLKFVRRVVGFEGREVGVSVGVRDHGYLHFVV